MSGHLGPLAAALADDQLTGSVRSRALRHVAECEGCRSEVGQQRAMKARLDGLGAPDIPSSLLDRLQNMRPVDAGSPAAPTGPPSPGESDDVDAMSAGTAVPEPASARRPSPGPIPGSTAPVPAAVPALSPGPGPLGLGTTARPWGAFGGPVGRQRVRRVLIGATSVVLLGGGAAYAAGGQGAAPAPVQPAVDLYTVQHGTTGGTMPLHDTGVTAVTVGLGR